MKLLPAVLLAGAVVAGPAIAQDPTARRTGPSVEGVKDSPAAPLPERVGCVAIPDDAYDGTVGSMICLTVADPNNGQTINDVNVNMSVEHSWVGDLVFKVVSPGGTVGTLVSRPGLVETVDDGTNCCGDSSDLIVTSPLTFDDQGGGPSAETMGGAIGGTAFICQDDGVCNYVSNVGAATGVGLADFNGLTASGGNWMVCAGDSGASDTGNLCDATIDFSTGSPGDLSITKTAPDGVVRDMNPYTFQLDVNNAGPSDHATVTVTDTLPGNVTFTGSSCGATAVGQDVTWNVGALTSGASSSCQLFVNNNVAGCPAVTNTAVVAGEMGISDPAGNNTSTFANAPVGGNVIADPSFETGTPNAAWAEASSNFGTPLCDVGGCGTGTGTGPRTGAFWAWFGGISSLEVGSVQQSVVIGAGAASLDFWVEFPVCAAGAGAADFVRATIDGTEVWRADASSALCGVIGYSQVTVDVSAFGDGGSHTVRFESTSGTTGVGTNFFVDDITLSVSGTPVCTDPPNADLVIGKLATAPSPLSVGDTITYTLLASNTGPGDATGVVVTDPLPANVTYVSNTCGATFAAGTLTWNIGGLLNGAGASCDVVVTVNAVGGITNTATVTGNEADPTPANNAGTSTLAGAFLADVVLLKSNNATGGLAPGDAFSFFINVTNNGPTDATNVVVTDVLSNKVSYVANTCGATVTGATLTWTIPTLANGAEANCEIQVIYVGLGDVINLVSSTANEPDPIPANNTDIESVATANAVPVPALNGFTLAALAALMAGLGLWMRRRFVKG
ncbi:MAG: DUF11 domain-containing protein [Lysobacterales bacterium]